MPGFPNQFPAKLGWIALLLVMLVSSAPVSAQVTLTPDSIEVTRTSAAVKVTAGNGSAFVEALGISGTVSLILPTIPPGTVDSSSNVRFPATLNIRIQQKWTAGSTTVTIERAAFGRCSTNLDERDCPINFLEKDAGGFAYLDADIQVVAPGSSSFPVITVRYRWATGVPQTVLPDLEPVIEVVQTTQTEQGDVPLIAGKKTVVRVFAVQSGPQAPPSGLIRAKLYGWALNAAGDRIADLGQAPVPAWSITASVAKAERENGNASINFLLPDSWTCRERNNDERDRYCKEPVRDLELRAELQLPANRDVAHSDKLVKQKTVSFIRSRPLRIVYFPLGYIDKDGRRMDPTRTISNHDGFLRKLYPIDPNDLQYVQIPIAAFGTTRADGISVTADGVTIMNTASQRIALELIAAISTMLAAPDMVRFDQAVGWLPAFSVVDFPAMQGTFGLADSRFLDGQGKVAWAVDDILDLKHGQFLLAHEVGHNLGDLRHTGTDDRALDPKCRVSVSRTLPEWGPVFHYTQGTVQQPGYDPSESRFIPLTMFDVMNYCPPEKTWISPEQYKKLINRGENASPGGTPRSEGRVHETSALANTDYLSVSGGVASDDSEARLSPALRFSDSGEGDRANPSGAYCLRSSGASGVLADFCFSPRWINPDTETPYTYTYFSFKIPYQAGTTRLALVKQGTDRELAVLTAGDGPPTVSITSPRAGERWNGNISWTGNDPGGLPLSYRVDFSNDGGVTWYPMSLGRLTGTQLELDPSKIAGGPNVYFRVMAMNGLGTGSATVGPINVEQTTQLSPGQSTIDFGTVSMGQTQTRDLPLRSTGTGPYTVQSLSIDNPDFQAQLSLPSYIWVGSEGSSIPVSFEAASPGVKEATLTINGGVTVRLRATVVDRPLPFIATAQTIDFGTVNIGQSASRTLTISNTGNGPLTVSSLRVDNAQFTVTPASLSPIAPGGSVYLTLRFAPTAAGALRGILSIASDDTDRPLVTVSMLGTAVGTTGGTGQTSTLQVDDGGVEETVGFPEDNPTAYFVNRLTPARYPATLRTVQILFPAGELAAGSQISIVAANNSRGNGGTTLNGLSLQRTTATVSAVGRLVEFTVPPLTIQSGDFIVGFSLVNPRDVYPAAVDTSSGSKQRSYLSTDGTAFRLLDSFTGAPAGNFLIRAGVEYGASPVVPPFTFEPSSLTFTASEVGQTKIVRAMNSSSTAVTILSVTSSNPSFVSTMALPATIGANSFNNVTIRFAPVSSGPQTGTITLVTSPASAGGSFTVTGTSTGGSKITPTAAAGWPNGRLSNNLPPNAIDGSLSSFTWTTESFNSVNPSYLGIGFDATTVSRIRIYKDNNAGGPGLIAKNLTVEYTTSPSSTPLSARVWLPVSGLTNGFQGVETILATSVNSNGTVTADNHDSAVNGWASLTFNAVNATGIRIGFSNATPISVNHYRVYEFEAYGSR